MEIKASWRVYYALTDLSKSVMFRFENHFLRFVPCLFAKDVLRNLFFSHFFARKKALSVLLPKLRAYVTM